MSLIKRCYHQIVPPGSVNSFFKEQWERCERCEYDPENNEKCPAYSPTTYEIKDPTQNSSASEQINEKQESILRVIRA